MPDTKTLDQEAFDIRHANQVELAKRELARRSQDTIRVYNPLDTTFSFMYDRYWHRIPPKSYKDFPRYLAQHFFKKICDYMIGQQITKGGEELKALREKQLGKQFLDKYEENVQVWDRQPKLDDPDLIEQIKQAVLIGVVEEYGMDEPEPDPVLYDKPLDYRPLHEQIFSNLDHVSQALPQVDPATIKPINEILHPSEVSEEKAPKISKKELEKEITSEDK